MNTVKNLAQSDKNYQVATYECGYDATLHTGTIFNWLQDSMDYYSAERGIGHDFCQKNGITYVLKNYDVQIKELPHRSDNVTLQTNLSDSSQTSLFFVQKMYDSQTKKQLLTSASQVVLLDLSKGRPVRLRNILPQNALISSHEAISFANLPPLAVVQHTQTQEITPDYIDFNKHVNNTNYVVFAERAAVNAQKRIAFLKKARLKRIQIAYKRAATLEDSPLSIQTKVVPGFTEHRIVSENNQNMEFARLRLNWARKER